VTMTSANINAINHLIFFSFRLDQNSVVID
jgi:hypothetical protein